MQVTQLQPGMVQVVSTPPAKVAEFEHVISWSRRSTDKTPVKESERYRGIVVPKSQLKVPDDAAVSKFHRLIQATIDDLADTMFRVWVAEHMASTECDSSRFTVDNVLAFWAEERQRQLVDGAQIVEFLTKSATFKKFDAAKKQVWLSKLPKIAAPSYKNTFTKEQAASVLAQFADDDLQHTVCAFIAQRCNNILTTESVQEVL